MTELATQKDRTEDHRVAADEIVRLLHLIEEITEEPGTELMREHVAGLVSTLADRHWSLLSCAEGGPFSAAMLDAMDLILAQMAAEPEHRGPWDVINGITGDLIPMAEAFSARLAASVEAEGTVAQ